CGDQTANRIYALWASDLTVKWVFNAPATASMDYVSGGCALDYVNNRIYCGSNQALAGQSTLWALNTGAPSGSNALIWSYNAGSIKNRPQLGQSAQTELYVASSDGTLQKRNAATGTLDWSFPNPVPIVRNPWPEFRGPLPTRIYYTLESGV